MEKEGRRGWEKGKENFKVILRVFCGYLCVER